MIRTRLKEFGTHPVFLSLVQWVIIILFIPPLFSRYRVKQMKDEILPPNNMFIYCDLNGDNQSERISFDLNDTEQTNIQYTRNEKIIEQYNLRYHPQSEDFFYSGDYNNDGFMESYVFTISQDSIFLNIIDPLCLHKTIISSRFIDTWKKAAQSAYKPYIKPVEMLEVQGRKDRDFLFYINAGFSKQPRNVYRYLIREDSLIKSPESSVVIDKCFVSELDNRPDPELIMNLRATGNFSENSPFSDQFTWLMILDHNLKFLFSPLRICEYPSRILVLPLRLKNRTCLAVLLDYFGTENISSAFSLYDTEGNKIYDRKAEGFENAYSAIFPNQDNDMQTFYFMRNRKVEIVELDSNFRVLNTITIPGVERTEPVAQLDADMDGKKEYIFLGYNRKSLVITQSDFKFPVVYQYDTEFYTPVVTPVLIPGRDPLIFVQMNDYGIYLRFDKNPLYYLKYPFYAGIYIVVFLFITLIYHIQRYRLNQNLETEKRIASLQMKAIKNQIDPHFTLNILNAIGSLYATEENREKADYVFGKYAKMIRQTVISSDKIIVTLAEELEFVRNYLDLEKFRSNDSFQYIIEADPEADMQIKVPRMLIHTFAENAIKYGVRKRNNSGLLQIHIRKNEKACEITVEDNGPGLVRDELPEESTGKGLVIVKELADLYYRIEKSKISFSLQNIPGNGTLSLGTKAIIELFIRNPKLS
jgi:two-component sensor histidine kinase